MAFWFQLPTYWQKKKEEEEKKLPMQSKVPMQSNIPSNETTPTVQTQASNRAGGIPTKPMMSYNIEGTILSWVADDKATKILDYAKKNAKTPEEQKLLIKDMHTEAIKMEQKKMFEKDRTDMKAQVMKDMMKETDPVKQKQIGITIKLAEFADTVRDWSISQWIDPNDPDDQSVSTKFIEANPQLTDTFTDFVNWKITNVDLGKQIGLIPTEEEPVEEEEKANMLENIGKVWFWVWAVAWWLWASYVWWWLLKSAGKKIYWLTLPPWQQEAEAIQSYKSWISNVKPKTTVQTAIETPLLQKWWRTLSSKLWQFGTRGMIGTQAEAKAKSLFTKTINPIMKEADKIWISFNYKDLIEEAKKNIENSNIYSSTQKTQIIEDITEIWKNYEWNTTLQNLDLEKQWLASKIPQKYQTMAKLPNETKVAQKELASVFRNKVHSTIKSIFWVDSAKIYQDYANLKWLSKIWPKALTEAGRKWGAWNLLSWVADELGTPITTTIGKLSYKAWELSQKLPKIMLKLLKASPKILSKVSWSMAWAEMVDINQIWQEMYNSQVKFLKKSVDKLNKWEDVTWMNFYKVVYQDMKKRWKTNDEIKKYFESELKDMEANPYKNKKTALIDYLWK